MAKAIYFDMDGTLNRLFDVPQWLEKLSSSDPSPYLDAAPKVDMKSLKQTLVAAKEQGHRIGIISWLSKDSTKEYDNEVRHAKRQWLNTHLGIPFDEIHLVKYGTPKHLTPNARATEMILVDDNAEVRKQWETTRKIGKYRTINAEKDWLQDLQEMLK